MSFKFYDILGIPKNVSQDDIRKAYKKKAIKTHPDKGGNEEEFKKLTEAYEVLNDEEKRKIYDQVGDDGWSSQGQGGPNINPEEIFKSFFGGMFGQNNPFGFGGNPFGPFNNQPRQQQKRKMDDVIYNIEISMNDCYFGIRKNIKINIEKPCFKCMKQCDICKGSGVVIQITQRGPMNIRNQRPCDHCRGIGISHNNECNECNNQGKKQQEERIEMNIPRGVQSGFIFTFSGFGKQPMKEEDIPGDLIIQIIVNEKNTVFKRRGQDLIYETTISLKDAIVGTKLKIPHFTGDIFKDISEFGIIKEGKEYSIPKLGFDNANLILKFNIETPNKILSIEDKNKLFRVLDEIGF